MLRKIIATVGVFLFAYAVAGPAIAGSPSASDKVLEWHTWKIPSTECDIPVNGDGRSANKVPLNCDEEWPQQYVGAGDEIVPPCETWYQVDKYYGTRSQIDGVLDHGTLTFNNNKPEDWEIVKDWFFLYGGDCTDPQPESKVEYSDWKDGTWECPATTVTQTRTKTVTPYKLVEGEWVKDTENAVEETETQTRNLTANELKRCDTPDVCTNLDDKQTSVPDGWVVENGKCFHVEIVCWLMDNYEGDNPHADAGKDYTFPQTRVDCDDPIPCGMWVQKDKYLIDSFTKEEVWLNLGDTLTFSNGKPEDHKIYKQHWFIAGEDCAPVDVCIDYEKVTISAATYAANPQQYTLWAAETCQPPVDVCKNLGDAQAEVPEGWTEKDGYCFHKEIVCWEMDNYNGGSDTPPAGHSSTFPQTRVDCETEIPCGVWIQKDWYLIDSWSKEEVWLNLGDTLTYNHGGPEDASIYVKHKFIYGGDCEPPVEVCEYINGVPTKVTYEAGTAPEGSIPWVNGDECVPTIKICVWDEETKTASSLVVPITERGNAKEWVNGDECTPPNIDPSIVQPVCLDGAPYIRVKLVLDDPGNNSTGGDTIDLRFFKGANEHVLNDVPLVADPVLDNVWWADILWPGAEVTGGAATGWPGWELQAGAWINIGDGNFGWTREGVQVTISYNPEMTADLNYPPASFECEEPPPAEICEYTAGDDLGHKVILPAGTAIPEGAIPWVDGSECTPADICPNVTLGEDLDPNLVGIQTEIPEGYQWLKDKTTGEFKCAKPPTLGGTIVSAQCESDVPWIDYDISFLDPYNVSTGDEFARFSFTANGYTEEIQVINYELNPVGRFLWPGASVEDNGDGTFTATGWPGWALIDEVWEPIGDDNYGWTRDGVTVSVEVNPTYETTLAYPPPTDLCVYGPPTEIHDELDAPPAKAVVAEAQYAG